jgi:hypothetical protein
MFAVHRYGQAAGPIENISSISGIIHRVICMEYSMAYITVPDAIIVAHTRYNWSKFYFHSRASLHQLGMKANLW